MVNTDLNNLIDNRITYNHANSYQKIGFFKINLGFLYLSAVFWANRRA